MQKQKTDKAMMEGLYILDKISPTEFCSILWQMLCTHIILTMFAILLSQQKSGKLFTLIVKGMFQICILTAISCVIVKILWRTLDLDPYEPPERKVQ